MEERVEEYSTLGGVLNERFSEKHEQIHFYTAHTPKHQNTHTPRVCCEDIPSLYSAFRCHAGVFILLYFENIQHEPNIVLAIKIVLNN